MKTKIFTLYILSLFCLTTWPHTSIHGQQPEYKNSVKTESTAGSLRSQKMFQSPSYNPSIHLSQSKGDIKIVGTDNNQMIIKYYEEDLKDTGESDWIVYNEKSNELNIDSRNLRSNPNALNLDLQIPKNSRVRIDFEDEGGIDLNHLDNELEINALKGDINLHDISNQTSINLIDGNITADFTNIDEKNAVSIIVLKGDVSIFLPREAKLILRCKTQNGMVFNDFEGSSNAGISLSDDEDTKGNNRTESKKLNKESEGASYNKSKRSDSQASGKSSSYDAKAAAKDMYVGQETDEEAVLANNLVGKKQDFIMNDGKIVFYIETRRGNIYIKAKD